MIAYTTLGTNNLDAALKFYDQLLAELGGRRVLELERIVFWGAAPDNPMVAVCKPHDGEAATHGNGTMLALAVKNKEEVDRLHAFALSIGATDEGAPGARGPGFYIGYFRDLDGNKLNFFCGAG